MKGIARISGNTSPRINESNYYEVKEYYSGTQLVNDADIKWKLYAQRADSSWRELKGPLKTGSRVTYKFPQKWYGKRLMIEAYLFNPERKAEPGLIVAPIPGEPEITKAEILDAEGKPLKDKPHFLDTVILRATTVNMLGADVAFSLWENETFSDNYVWGKQTLRVQNSSGVVEAKLTLNSAIKNRSGILNEDWQQQLFLLVEAPSTIEESGSQDAITTNQTASVAVKGGAPKTNNSQQQESGAVVEEQALEDEKTEGNSECYCNRDFRPEEFEKIIHGLRDSETQVKKDSGYSLFAASNCNIKVEDKTIDKLRTEFNSIFTSYNINTCLRKLHFIAQIYHETDRLRTTKEYADGIKYDPGKHKDAISSGNTEKGDGEKYKGRGLMQLTWKNNYKIYKYYSGTDVITNYQTVSDNLHIACDSAGWYWKEGKILGVGKRWKGPVDPPLYVKILKPDYPKTTISWQDDTTKRQYGTVDLGLIADDDKVDLISYLVNGGANGLNERRNYVNTLKFIFEYPQKCVNKKTVQAQNNQSSSESVTIRLVRKWQTNKSTIGEFMIDNTTIKGYILEEKGPDTTVSGNEQRVPIGTYNLEWHSGTKIKKGLKLFNDVVSKDRAILIHSGNTADDTEGCLLPGSTKNTDFVGGSKDKLKEIFDYVEEIGIKDAKIVISQDYE